MSEEPKSSLAELPTRYLDEANKTDHEGKIKFADEGHKYWIWSKYLQDWPNTDDGCGALPVISSTTILKKYFPSPDFKALAIKIWNNPGNRRMMVSDSTYKYFGCTCVDDILKKWSNGSTLGTKMHAVFEDFANLVEYDRAHKESPRDVFEQLFYDVSLEGYFEKQYFLDFCVKFGISDGRRRFWRTEFLMAHDVLHISGMIDGLVYDTETDTYIIIDWKRMKQKLPKDPANPRKRVRDLVPSSRGMGLPAFEDLRNHSGNVYGCQLTLYKHLFEHMFPGKKISGMYLVVVESTKLGKREAMVINEVPLTKYDDCIKQLFEARANEIMATTGNNLPHDLVEKLVTYLSPQDQDSSFSSDDDEWITCQ